VSYSAAAEVDRFLELHPTFTRDTDNPVELLEDLKSDYDELAANYEDLEREHDELKERHALTSPEALAHASAQIADLVKFIRKLHDARKICDLEMQEALDISKRIPPHSAESNP